MALEPGFLATDYHAGMHRLRDLGGVDSRFHPIHGVDPLEWHPWKCELPRQEPFRSVGEARDFFASLSRHRPTDPWMRADLKSVIATLDMMMPGRQVPPFAELTRRVFGIVVQPPDEDAVEAAMDAQRRSFSEAFHVSDTVARDPQAVQRVLAKEPVAVPDESQVRAVLDHALGAVRPIGINVGGDYKVLPADLGPNAFARLITGDDAVPVFYYNTRGKHQGRAGRLFVAEVHESTHLVQLFSWQALAAAGELSPSQMWAGPMSSAVLAREMIGDAALRISPRHREHSSYTPIEKWRDDALLARRLVMHRAFSRLSEDQCSLAEAVSEVEQSVPDALGDTVVRAQLNSMNTNVLAAITGGTYLVASNLILSLQHLMGSEQATKTREFMYRALTEPLLARDTISMVQGLSPGGFGQEPHVFSDHALGVQQTL